MNDRHVRICLWSGPRNISTALMYSFAQRPDTLVFDEPLYAHYLRNSPARHYHPGAEETLAVQDNNGERVVQEVILGKHDRPVLFFKNMTHHLVEIDWSFLKQTVNVILTRDPREMLPSFAKGVPNPSLVDVGYAKHVELLQYLQQAGQQPPVLDARQVLLDPAGVLTQLCEQIGIDFDPAMLSWPAGPRPEDGVWAKYWYERVHKSTGFQPYHKKNKPFPESLEPLLAECLPYYNQIAPLAIQAEQ